MLKLLWIVSVTDRLHILSVAVDQTPRGGCKEKDAVEPATLYGLLRSYN